MVQWEETYCNTFLGVTLGREALEGGLGGRSPHSKVLQIYFPPTVSFSFPRCGRRRAVRPRTSGDGLALEPIRPVKRPGPPACPPTGTRDNLYRGRGGGRGTVAAEGLFETGSIGGKRVGGGGPP